MIDAAQAAEDEDYLLDCMAMLKAIVNQMSRHIDRLTDTERGLIDGAVNRVWEAKGRNGSIDDVIAALNETGNELASHLAIAMMPFSSAGTYGKFFQVRSRSSCRHSSRCSSCPTCPRARRNCAASS